MPRALLRDLDAVLRTMNSKRERGTWLRQGGRSGVCGGISDQTQTSWEIAMVGRKGGGQQSG